jgi:hypothetical protein
VQVGDAVEWVGLEESDHNLWSGLPGRIIDVGPLAKDVSVSFVNGPSIETSADTVRLLDEAEYVRRGRRAVTLVHPLRDVPIAGVMLDGQEWPEGEPPEA